MKPRSLPDKLFKINNLSVETYHLADKIFHIDQVVEFCGNLFVAFL